MLYVRTTAELAKLVDTLKGSGVLALDTEFMRERTYFAKLCLIQIGDGKTSAAIDPLEVEDLSPLFELFWDASIVKVLHAGQQDLEIFYHMTGKVPAPIFDTQVAAALASFPLQAGYGSLVEELLGVELDKLSSYTDWARRPLSDRQIEYALNDVRYLPDVYRSLRERLEEAGRIGWPDEDFHELEDPSTYEIVPESAYKRVKRRARLRRRQMGVLIELAAWREKAAMRLDIPRGRLANDEVLVQLAARSPQDVSQLAGVRGLHESVVRRDGSAIIAAVSAGLAMDEETIPMPQRRPRSSYDIESLTDIMSALVRTRAREYGIAVPVLASRKEMEELARGEREDSPLLRGWRASHIGEELVELLEGGMSLRIVDDEVVVSHGSEAG